MGRRLRQVARRRKRIREELKVGDTAFIYRTKPEADVYCEVKVVSNSYSIGTAWAIDVEPVRKLDPPVPLKAIRACPELGDLEFLRNSRVSVSHVSDGEYAAICDLVGRNEEPATTTPTISSTGSSSGWAGPLAARFGRHRTAGDTSKAATSWPTFVSPSSPSWASTRKRKA